MNKLILLLLLTTNSLLAKESLKLYVDTTMYFVSNEASVKIKKISQMKKYYGGFNEIHSSHEWRLYPGGVWNIETRLNEQNIFSIVFWIKDKNKPEINKDFNVSTLEMTTFTLLKTNKGELKINIVPKMIEEELQPIKLGADNFGLNHFCLRNSAIIVDDNFYVGKLTGFAERIELRFPNFYDIDISLIPLRDWKQIGTYNNGEISIDMDENHILTLLNVGVGPSGYQKGGPFKVYGAMKPPTHDRNDLLEGKEKYGFKGVSARIKKIISKANRENKFSIIGITTGNDNNTSKHLKRTIGDIFSDEDCG